MVLYFDDDVPKGKLRKKLVTVDFSNKGNRKVAELCINERL
jgi:hypothetical protein